MLKNVVRRRNRCNTEVGKRSIQEAVLQRFLVFSFASASLLVVAASACGGEPSSELTAVSEAPAKATAVTETPVAEPTAVSKTVERPFEDFDYDNFDRPTNIDNDWLPLRPGTRWVYEGFTNEGGLAVPHRVVFTVTDLTKVIDGVPTVVISAQDYSAGDLVETELAFFAQDNDGNVWRMGEYPEEYERGKFVDAPAWIAGLQNARAGISMKAEPQLGAPSYSQGWGPAVNWTDRAKVAQTGGQTCVPAGCYEDVLMIEETSQQEPDGFQQKSYAPGVGNVQVGWRGADATKETLELVEVVQLSPEALAEVRVKALELEKRAYEIRKDLYGQTPPAEHAPDAAGP